MARAIEQPEGWRDMWTAATRNMRRGWSWSGFERSKFFLNDGTARFTDVAQVIGADQVSDGRGLAAGDLDGDGDLDLVGTCSRTHPHVYVLRNDLRTERHFALVRVEPEGHGPLAGTRVVLEAGGRAQRRDIALGSGFVSQHATVQHFGLGDAARIDRLEVTWPDGSVQSHRPEGVDATFVVRQGQAELERVSPRPRNYNATGRLPAVEWDSEWHNLHLVDGPWPDLSGLQLVDTEGQARTLVTGAQGLRPGGPMLLLNLWATWCANCRAEMPELVELHRDGPAGLRVLGLSLDEEEETQVAEVARDWGLNFPTVHLTGDARGAFFEQLEGLFEREGGLALPTSLLLNPQGRVMAVAQGTLDAERLVGFVEHFRASLPAAGAGAPGRASASRPGVPASQESPGH